MANETITDDYVRDHFRDDALFASIKFERQKSTNKRICELLKGKSKKGNGGDGKPDFIITFPSNCNYIIVGESKPSPTKHESKERNKPVEYAVDGVLHYAQYLKEEFNVLAIAVSGSADIEMTVSHFYWKKGKESYSELQDTKLLGIDDYLQVFSDQFFISDFFTRDIAFKARYLNEEFNAYTIPEYKRCTMISAMLLALINNDFKEKYENASTTKDLGKDLLAAIDSVFDSEADLVRNKSLILTEFATILNEPIFSQKDIKHKKHKEAESTLYVLKEFLKYLHKYVYPLVEHSNIGYDVLGRFYIEFIRYAASEQKSGLVLTPAHITELFCDLAELRLSDVVYDPCCGTGGFLVAAMQRLFNLAGNDKRKREEIRKRQICGVELRPDIFTYACSSMRFRGDGKSNIYNGSCFTYESIIKDNHKPTVAFLNPPYDVGNARQLEFIEHALNVLNPQSDGRVVAIVQFSCAIKDEKELLIVKKRILAKHHLKAVLSMPDDLFYPVGVVTCIMVFEANKPNKGKKTWFAYCKDDGLEKRKHLGRIDVHNKYTSIKESWLSAYRNVEERPGFSVRKEVHAEDEWCAEAYMETDYQNLQEIDFVKKLHETAANMVAHNDPYEYIELNTSPASKKKLTIDTRKWQIIRFDELFSICKGFYNKKPECHTGTEIPFIGAIDKNNGVSDWYSIEDIEESSKTGDDNNAPLEEKLFDGNCITVSNNGSVGFAFYQTRRFTCTHDVNPLFLHKQWNTALTPLIAMFLCTLIEKERYRWTYGRKWRPKRMPDSELKLPMDKEGKPDWTYMEEYISTLPFSQFIVKYISRFKQEVSMPVNPLFRN